ncbi:helix-turn-helix domain-containing protein [Vagococcus fluvialis]|uniref:helix-turn-helix domain-containing protein n=1 Tax=Vagococcus fluvialis TaxID=2738 RepID=UPI0037A620D7
MIEISLKDVMNSKNKTITDIHNATGISRNTLGLLANGVSKGIQFDTLEKIINFLDCDIEDILEVTFDNQVLNITLSDFSEENSIIKITNEQGYYITLFSVFNFEDDIFSIEVTFDDNSQQKTHTTYNFLNSLSRYQLEALAIKISYTSFKEYMKLNDLKNTSHISFNWEFSIISEKLSYGYFWNIAFVENPIYKLLESKYRNENLVKI